MKKIQKQFHKEMLKELDKLFPIQNKAKNNALLLLILSEVKLERMLDDGKNNSNNKAGEIG